MQGTAAAAAGADHAGVQLARRRVAERLGDLDVQFARRFEEIAAADVAAPDVAATDIAASDIAPPDIAAPDVATSDVAAADIPTSDIAAPDVAAAHVQRHRADRERARDGIDEQSADVAPSAKLAQADVRPVVRPGVERGLRAIEVDVLRRRGIDDAVGVPVNRARHRGAVDTNHGDVRCEQRASRRNASPQAY